MANSWLRFYHDFLTDEKIIQIAFEDQRHYLGVLILKSNGTLDKSVKPDLLDKIVAQSLWIGHDAIREVKQRLISVGLIDAHWQPLGWEKRQRLSDQDLTGAERQRRYRERNGKNNALHNVECNAVITLPDTDKNRLEKTTTTTDDSCDGGGCDVSLLVGPFSADVKQLVSVLPYLQAQAVLDEISGQLSAGVVIKSVKALARNLVNAVLNGTFTDDYATVVAVKRQRKQANEKRLEEARKKAAQTGQHKASNSTEKREMPDAHRAEIEALIGSKIKKG
jgi:hypothetical protein